jgi:hypothetical protein
MSDWTSWTRTFANPGQTISQQMTAYKHGGMCVLPRLLVASFPSFCSPAMIRIIRAGNPVNKLASAANNLG